MGVGTFTNCYMGGCVIREIYCDPKGDPMLGGAISLLNSTSALVEHCTISDCGQAANPHGSQGGVAGFAMLECDRCIAQFNECHGIVTTIRYDGTGFDIDGGCSHCILQYNYSHDNDGSGLQLGTFEGSTRVTDNTIRYNVSLNDAKKNARYSGGMMTYDRVYDCQMYNNTVISGPGRDGGKPAAFLGSGGGVSVRNNIFVVTHDGPIAHTSGGYKLQNNCYYRANGSFGVWQAGKDYSSLAEWQAATGQEKLDDAAVGFFADPRLRGFRWGEGIPRESEARIPVAFDLLPGSPLIGKGLDLETLFQISPGRCDFHGAPLRAGKQFDLGAVRGPAKQPD